MHEIRVRLCRRRSIALPGRGRRSRTDLPTRFMTWTRPIRGLDKAIHQPRELTHEPGEAIHATACDHSCDGVRPSIRSARPLVRRRRRWRRWSQSIHANWWVHSCEGRGRSCTAEGHPRENQVQPRESPSRSRTCLGHSGGPKLALLGRGGGR